MNINLKQLETFVWVADLGSFRRAAERMNTTQPNVSSRIASLEASLGIVLMDRDAGSVRLTAIGEELLGRARIVLGSIEDFIQAADESASSQDVLRLGVTEMIVHTWLRSFMQVFKDQYPEIVIELVVDLSVNLERELLDRSIDLAFQSGPFSQSMSGSEPLGTYPVVWVAASALALPAKITIDHLIEHSVLTHARNTQPYQEIASHFSQYNKARTRVVPSSNLSACLQMTTDGFGIAALLEPMVRSELDSGQLVALDYDWQPSPLSFFARFDKAKSSKLVRKVAKMAAGVSREFIAGH